MAKADAKAQSRLRRDEHIILRRLLTRLLRVRYIFGVAWRTLFLDKEIGK
jgi:hypothetical protein